MLYLLPMITIEWFVYLLRHKFETFNMFKMRMALVEKQTESKSNSTI